MPKTNVYSRDNYLSTESAIDYNLARLNQYVLDTSNVSFNSVNLAQGMVTGGNVEIGGNLNVIGTTTVISSTVVDIADNIIVINSGNLDSGVTTGGGLSGIEVDRGLLNNYQSVFSESDQTFKIGQVGTLQTVATREDTPLNYGVMVYNPTSYRLDSVSNITIPIVYSAGTASTSSTTGTVKVVGGLGVTGAINSGNRIAVLGTDYLNYISSDINNDFLINSPQNVVFNVASGKSIKVPSGANLTFGGSTNYISSNSTNLTLTSTTGDISLSAFSNVAIPVTIPLKWNAGNYIVSNGTDLTLYSTGTINMNGNVAYTSTTPSTSYTSASVVFLGGISMNNSTDAVSSSNGGTLTTAGGVAITKKLIVGGTISVGDIALSASQNSGEGVNLRSISRNLVTSSNVDTTFNSFEGGNLSTGNTVANAYTVNILGSPTLSGGGSLTNSYSLNVVSGAVKFGSKLILTDTTGSASALTGTLLMNGSIGINNATNATDIISGGTISTVGGASIYKDVYLGGKLDIGNINTSGVTQVSGNGITFRSRNKTLTTTSTNNVTFNSFEGGIISTSATIQKASTVYITGSPSITGGGILTNSYALEIASGNSLFNSKIIINETTNSTGTSIGSLLLNGSIANSNTVNSTSYTDGGSLTFGGGAAFAKDLYIGTKLITGSGGISIHRVLQTSSVDRFSIELKTTESGSNTGSNYNINRYNDIGTLIESAFQIKRDTGTVSVYSNITSSSGSVGALVIENGGLSINNSTNATSLGNGGSFTSVGGASISKDLYIGGNTYDTGSLTVQGISSFQKTLINTTNGFLSITGTNGITALVDASSSIATSAGSMTIGSNAGTLLLNGYSGITATSVNGSVSINAAGASNFTTSAGTMTVSGVGINLTSGAGAISATSSSSISLSSGTGGINLNTTDTSIGVKIGTTPASVPVTIGNSSSITLDGDLSVTGNFTVLGSTTTIDSTLITINDIAIVVNNAPNGISDGGLLIHRWQPPNDTTSGDLATDTPKETGLFQAGSSAPSTLILGTTSSAVNNYYKGWWIKFGTQMRRIKSYVGSTRTATIYVSADNQGPSPGPPFSDGMDISTAPLINTSYFLYDLPYIGVYYDAGEKEIRLTGVPFDPINGLFESPTTYVNLHVNSLIIEEALVATGDTTINGRLTVNKNAVDALVIQKVSGGGEIFTVDTLSGTVAVANPSFAISSKTGLLFNQYDTLSDVKTYSTIESTILGNVAGSLSSKLTFDVQNGGTSVANYLTLNGDTGVADFSSNISNVRILGTLTDSLLMSGGITINSTTDASSSTVGGTITTAGGLAVAKNAFFGSSINSVGIVKVGNGNTISGTEGTINTNGDITLYNSTSQTIFFAGAGSAIPAFTTRSAGTKLVLKPSISGSSVDFGVGISANEMWYSVDNSSSKHSFYAGITKHAEIGSNGVTTVQAGTGFSLYNGSNTSKIYESSNVTRLIPHTTDSLKGFIFRNSSDTSDNIRVNSDGQITIGISNITGLPSSTGTLFNVLSNTLTDSVTAGAGTISTAVFNSFGQGTLNATNSSVTTTNTIGVYISGSPIQGTNETIVNSYGLYIDNVGDISSGTNVALASSLHINGAPTGNVTDSYALSIGSGSSLIGGKVIVSDTSRLLNTNTVSEIGAINSGGDITLTHGTSQTIYFKAVGSSSPSFTTRSAGTKIVLKPVLSGSSADYAFGVNTSSLWHTVPTTSESHQFYLGISNRFQIDNTGIQLDSSGTLTPSLVRLANNNKGIILNGGSGLGSSNGSQLELYGNTNTITGDAILSTGTSGTIILNTGLANALTIDNNGLVNIALATDTTGTGTGALNVVGGANISKSLFVGTSLNLDFNQKYSYTGDATGSLNIQSGTSSIVNRQRYFTADGDNTDNNTIDIYGLGNTGSLVNTEYLKSGYISSTTSYTISTKQTGTGSVRPINIETGSNTGQLRLNTDNTISTSSTTTSTSTTGAILMSGGITSTNTTNSTSVTSGGCMTLNGGAAIAKDLYLGGNLNITGSVSAGTSTPTITTDNTVNITGTITIVNNKLILNGSEAMFSTVFRFTPTAANTVSEFNFSVPDMTSNFANIYDLIITASGYSDDTLPINLENITGYAVTGTKNGKIIFTSGSTDTNTIMVISRYTVY
jgi:hypothetical protein